MGRTSVKLFTAFISLTVIAPTSLGWARAFDLREQVVYTDAFAEFVQTYDKAEGLYKNQGPQAFVDALMIESSNSEKGYLRKVLGSLPKLPKVSSDSALLILDGTMLGAGIHTVEVSNIDDGMLIVDGNPVEFDPAKNDLESLSKKIESSLDRSTMKVSFLNAVQNSIFPVAHASAGKAAAWMVLGAVGGLATSWVWSKWKNRGNEEKDPKTADEGGTTSAAAATHQAK